MTQLICAFVFASVKSRFFTCCCSYDVANIPLVNRMTIDTCGSLAETLRDVSNNVVFFIEIMVAEKVME